MGCVASKTDDASSSSGEGTADEPNPKKSRGLWWLDPHACLVRAREDAKRVLAETARARVASQSPWILASAAPLLIGNVLVACFPLPDDGPAHAAYGALASSSVVVEASRSVVLYLGAESARWCGLLVFLEVLAHAFVDELGFSAIAALVILLDLVLGLFYDLIVARCLALGLGLVRSGGGGGGGSPPKDVGGSGAPLTTTSSDLVVARAFVMKRTRACSQLVEAFRERPFLYRFVGCALAASLWAAKFVATHRVGFPAAGGYAASIFLASLTLFQFFAAKLGSGNWLGTALYAHADPTSGVVGGAPPERWLDEESRRLVVETRRRSLDRLGDAARSRIKAHLGVLGMDDETDSDASTLGPRLLDESLSLLGVELNWADKARNRLALVALRAGEIKLSAFSAMMPDQTLRAADAPGLAKKRRKVARLALEGLGLAASAALSFFAMIDVEDEIKAALQVIEPTEPEDALDGGKGLTHMPVSRLLYDVVQAYDRKFRDDNLEKKKKKTKSSSSSSSAAFPLRRSGGTFNGATSSSLDTEEPHLRLFDARQSRRTLYAWSEVAALCAPAKDVFRPGDDLLFRARDGALALVPRFGDLAFGGPVPFVETSSSSSADGAPRGVHPSSLSGPRLGPLRNVAPTPFVPSESLPRQLRDAARGASKFFCDELPRLPHDTLADSIHPPFFAASSATASEDAVRRRRLPGHCFLGRGTTAHLVRAFKESLDWDLHPVPGIFSDRPHAQAKVGAFFSSSGGGGGGGGDRVRLWQLEKGHFYTRDLALDDVDDDRYCHHFLVYAPDRSPWVAALRHIFILAAVAAVAALLIATHVIALDGVLATPPDVPPYFTAAKKIKNGGGLGRFFSRTNKRAYK